MVYNWNKMVTITVPVGLNGWVNVAEVTINGRKTRFPVGVETQVPYPVADVITRMIREDEEDNKLPPTKGCVDQEAREGVAALTKEIEKLQVGEEESRNLFNPASVIIGINTVGDPNSIRALSGPIYVGSQPFVVSCRTLPSNLKYQIVAYTTDQYSGFDNSLVQWIDSADTVTNSPRATEYVRFLFGSVNDAALTKDDFAGLELQLEMGTTATEYVPYGEGKKPASEFVTLSVMQFNAAVYSHGQTNGYTGDDAMAKLKEYRNFFNENATDIANINEYYRYFDNAKTLSAREMIFNPVYRYCFNDLITSLFSRYALKDTTSGYLGASDTEEGRYYVKGYIEVDGVRICVVGCHLTPAVENAVEKRAQQIEELLAVVENDKNVILLGDYNVATVDEYEPFLAAGYKLANGGYVDYMSTQGHKTDGKPFDNIIVSNNIYVSNVKVHHEWFDKLTSDHFPVTCDLHVYPN